MYGGLIDRVHDLLLCGVDPSLVDLSVSLEDLKSDAKVDHLAFREMESLLRASSHPWEPSRHVFLFGSQLKACIASLCLVKVSISVDIEYFLRLSTCLVILI